MNRFQKTIFFSFLMEYVVINFLSQVHSYFSFVLTSLAYIYHSQKKEKQKLPEIKINNNKYVSCMNKNNFFPFCLAILHLIYQFFFQCIVYCFLFLLYLEIFYVYVKQINNWQTKEKTW